MNNIYLDHNATTPVHDDVFEAMVPFLKERFGNPSSIHWAGRNEKSALADARDRVAGFLGCTAAEIIFTSSGTEGDNHALKGIALSKKGKGNHIITTTVEHPAILNTCKFLEKQGYEVTYLGVDEYGNLDLGELTNAITEQTILISIMYANNETGVIFPIKEIAKIAKSKKVIFHTDAVQAAGKLKIDVKDLGVDLLTISAHKIYGPKGVGALYVKRGVRITPLIHGGHHERNRRGGTENVSGIAGLAKACEIATADMEAETAHLKKLRDRLEEGLLETISYTKLNGDKENRIPNTTNISFEFIEGEGLLLSLDMLGVATSSGSACTSGSLEPSHVLLAMGLSHEMSHGSVRFSLGRSNTEADIDLILKEMPPIVARMRSMSPMWDAKAGGASGLTF